MRLKTMLTTAAVVLILAAAASAMPVGGLSYNIGGPSFSISSGVGFLQRDVHVIRHDIEVDEATSSRWLVKANVAPFDYLDAYGTVGAADFKLEDSNYRASLVTAYGGGMKLQVLPLWFFKSNLNVAADLQYIAFHAQDEVEGVEIDSRYKEFQAAAVIAYKLRDVVPYGGLKYNPVLVDITGKKNDLEGDMDGGVFIGADFYVTPTVFFTGELSIFSETSIFLMVGYNFTEQKTR